MSETARMWEPVNPAHAVQNANASVVLGAPASMQELLPAARAVAAALGMGEDQPMNAMSIAFDGTNPPSVSNESAGHSFFRNEAGQTSLLLTVKPTMMQLDTFSYTRWVGFRAEAEHMLGLLAGPWADSPVQAVGLEYTDIFKSVAAVGDTSLIIDRRSPSFPPSADASGFWHSQAGWFEDQGHLLVNVDLASSNGANGSEIRHVVSIRTHETRNTAADGQMGIDGALGQLDAMHISLKERLGALLTRDAQDMIALGKV